MTPAQEDSILKVLRPVFPDKSPDQLRELIQQIKPINLVDPDLSKIRADVITRFPNLAKLFKN